MQPRTEAAIGLTVFAALITLAAISGRSQRNAGDEDARASSFLSGPHGLKGMADVITRDGRRVVRWRGEGPSPFDAAPPPALVIVADPVVDPSGDDIVRFFEEQDDALLAGEGAESWMLCAGYHVRTLVLDSARVRHPDNSLAPPGWVHAVLWEVPVRERTMKNPEMFGDPVPCPALQVMAIDTLLQDDEGRPVMVRLRRDDREGSLYLLADVALISNTVLRTSALAPWLLGTVLSRARTVVFDEASQGFGSGGSLGGTVLAWSRRNPLGWMFWQLAIVAALAFLSGAVRFGSVVEAIPRTRRSSREHVRALATALAAAKGHDVAIGAIVRGLRRRLAGPARGAQAGSGADWREWVTTLEARAPTAKARERARRLVALKSPGQSNAAVRSAANVVEDVWEALHH